MAVPLNSAIKIPLQPLDDSWEIVSKQVNLDLLDGNVKVWSGNQPAARAQVFLNKQTCYVTVVPQSDSFILKVEGTAAPACRYRLSARPTPIAAPTPTPIAATPEPRPGPYIRPASFERNPLLPARPTGN